MLCINSAWNCFGMIAICLHNCKYSGKQFLHYTSHLEKQFQGFCRGLRELGPPDHQWDFFAWRVSQKCLYEHADSSRRLANWCVLNHTPQAVRYDSKCPQVRKSLFGVEHLYHSNPPVIRLRTWIWFRGRIYLFYGIVLWFPGWIRMYVDKLLHRVQLCHRSMVRFHRPLFLFQHQSEDVHIEMAL